MRATWRTWTLALLSSIVFAGPCFAQGQTAATTPPAFTPDRIEHLLLNGKIIDKKGGKKGVTDQYRVTLSDGELTHEAQVQDVDIYKPLFQVDPKHTEINFRDSFRYNIAGYRLALLLGLDNVPMSVERTVAGKPSAVTWWVDDVVYDEGDRRKKGPIPGVSELRTLNYLHAMVVFDELIQNRDRNGGNILWTKDGKMWMIDHTRAFRLGKDLRMPEKIERCDRTLFLKMQELTEAKLDEVMGDVLKKEETEALLERRDKLVQLIQERISQKSEAAVLYTLF